MPSAATRPPLTYATKTGRAAWLELAKFASHHTVDPVGMLQCLPGIFPVLYARGKMRRINWSGAPTWRPFAVCQRDPVTTAFGKMQFAGVAAPASSVMNAMERPIFSKRSRQRPSGKDEEPCRPARAKWRTVRRYEVSGAIDSPATRFAAIRNEARLATPEAVIVVRDEHAAEVTRRARTSKPTP